MTSLPPVYVVHRSSSRHWSVSLLRPDRMLDPLQVHSERSKGALLLWVENQLASEQCGSIVWPACFGRPRFKVICTAHQEYGEHASERHAIDRAADHAGYGA